MMKSLASVALTGIAGLILWEILKILMAPVIDWILGVLATGLKIGLLVAVACLAIYGVRRVMQARDKGEAGG